MAEREPEHGGGGGGGVGKKFGPLPVWAWAVLFGGGIGLVWFLRKQASSKAAADTSTTDTSATAAEPTDIVPVNQGLGADQAQAILDAIKDLQGEVSKEEDEDEEEEKPKPTPLPAPLPGKPPPKPKPAPKPKPKPRPYVVTKKWTTHNTPWQSTLWGIANHYHTKGGWQHLQKINHMHGDPRTHLKPGMKVYLS